jgi:hypothetical protein
MLMEVDGIVSIFGEFEKKNVLFNVMRVTNGSERIPADADRNPLKSAGPPMTISLIQSPSITPFDSAAFADLSSFDAF